MWNSERLMKMSNIVDKRQKQPAEVGLTCSPAGTNLTNLEDKQGP